MTCVKGTTISPCHYFTSVTELSETFSCAYSYVRSTKRFPKATWFVCFFFFCFFVCMYCSFVILLVIQCAESRKLLCGLVGVAAVNLSR